MKNKLLWIVVGALITCAVALGGIFGFDIPLYMYMRGFDWRGFDIIGSIFSVKNWLAISLLVVVIFYVRKIIQTKSKANIFDMYAKIRGSYAFWVLCSVCSATIVGGVIKLLVGRMRPIFYEALNTTGFYPFATDWAFHSMPSGHTLASFAGLVMIGMLAPRGRWFAWLLATIIGVSRVCVGAHWPSDVIVGAFIGTVTAIIVKDILSRRINK
jgi:membrane-associated phospholipid phosphatase